MEMMFSFSTDKSAMTIALCLFLLPLTAPVSRPDHKNDGDDDYNKSNSNSHDITESPTCPCRYSEDTVYGGVLVDCQDRQLVSLPPPACIPANTTSLLLQSNSINHLENVSLRNATWLCFLSLENNNLRWIDPAAFRFNTNLRVLHLQTNQIRLDNETLQEPLFLGLRNLVELNIGDSQNRKLTHSFYPSSLLTGLSNLRSLTLDTFYNDLYFNGIFKETPNLTTLTLGGGLITIQNETFQGFASMKLKQLTISHAQNFHFTEMGAFRNLIYLDSFLLINNRQGTKPTMESLAPFVHQNFTSIYFNNLNRDKTNLMEFKRDCQLSQYISRYLSQICVKHFTFTQNNLFFIEPRTLTSATWSRCLVSLDMSKNPLLGDIVELLHFTVMHSLKFLSFRDRKYSFLNSFKGYRYLENLSLEESKTSNVVDKSFQFDFVNCSSYSNNEVKTLTELKSKSYGNFTYFHRVNGTLTVFLPKNLENWYMDGFSTNAATFGDNVNVIGGGNLHEIYWSDSGLKELTGKIHGMAHLKLLDISKNDGTNINADFLNSFPELRKLYVSRMGLNKKFLSTMSENIFQGLYNLEHVDMSWNNLHILPNDIFTNNKLLKYLNLAGNRFMILPFDLDHLPILKILDIRENSILEFPKRDTASLDQHAMSNENFSVLLNGNLFSCSCYSIGFMHWLQVTIVQLDNQRNYSCTLENGKLATTKGVSDVQRLWRHCNGKIAFLSSLILVCLTALGFSLLTIGIKFKTQITASIFQFFSANFYMKRPQDYPLGVYIGYSDQDTDFACGMLRVFVENRLKLTTYIRHRDLIPASNIAESIVSAINSSWRSLLVITEDYLQDPWSYLAMKTAMFAVRPSNPDRLVMVILSHDPQRSVEREIPPYVLRAVRQENIIKVRSYQQNDMTERQQEALRNALLGNQ